MEPQTSVTCAMPCEPPRAVPDGIIRLSNLPQRFCTPAQACRTAHRQARQGRWSPERPTLNLPSAALRDAECRGAIAGTGKMHGISAAPRRPWHQPATPLNRKIHKHNIVLEQ